MEAWLTPSLIVALVALGVTVTTAIYNRKRDTAGDWQEKINELKDEAEKTEEKLSKARDELSVLKTKVDLFWQTVERVMAKQFRDD